MRKILIFLLIFSLSLTSFTLSSASAIDKMKWTQKAQSLSNTFNSVTFGNGLYVAVGEEGMIAVSKDGTTWEWVDSGMSRTLNKVIWNGKIFVAVGEKGEIVTSTDGRKWTRRDSTSGGDFNSIAWNGSYFVAVAFYPYKSVDGITWKPLDIDLKSFQILPDSTYAIIWDGKQFVMFGSGRSAVITSKDGRKWDLKCERMDVYGWIYDAASNGKTSVVVGDNGIVLTSTDYINWTEINLDDCSGVEWVIDGHKLINIKSMIYIKSIIWTGSQFIAVGGIGDINKTNPMILSSPDGKSWNSAQVDDSSRLNGIVYRNNEAICVGDNGGILKYDAETGWKSVGGQSPSNFNSIVYNGSTYIAVADNFKLLKSKDGINWIEIKGLNVENGYPSDYDLKSVVWNGRVFLAVGQKGITLMSQDGENWGMNFISANPAPSLQGVTWDGSRFIAVSGYYDIDRWYIDFEKDGNLEKGAVYSSTDGLNWTKAAIEPQKSMIAVASSSSVRVAVGAGGTILTSTDGVEWIKRESHTTKNLMTINYDGKGFITSGMGVVLYSEDGINWQEHSTGMQGTAYNAIWNGKQFVSVSYELDIQNVPQSIKIAFSTNGIDWRAQDISKPIKQIDNLLWDGKKYIAVCTSDTGTFLGTSADGIKWNLRLSLKNYNNISQIIFTGKLYVAVGYNGLILTSADGIKWVKRKSGTSLDLYSVTWDGTKLVAVGSGNTFQVLLTSKDGVNWAKGNPDKKNISGFAKQILWNGRQFLIVRDGASSVSKDGSKWTFEENGALNFNKVIWNGSFYIGVAGSGGAYPGEIVTSTDGLNWTTRVYVDFDDVYKGGIFDVAWNGKEYFAIGDYNTYTSKDGIKWDERVYSDSETFLGVASNGSSYIAVGPNGHLSTSNDGINWLAVKTNKKLNLKSVFWDGNKYVVLGDNGIVFTGEF